MIGLAYAVLPARTSKSAVAAAVRFVKKSTPRGRYAAVAWVVASDWKASRDVEGLLVTALMGNPQERTENRSTDEWLFQTGLFVRCYDQPGAPPSCTWQVLLLRRQGAPPYTRLREAGEALPDPVRKASIIEVSDPAFTRDVANNVWHLYNDRVPLKIAARLYRLTSWSDDDLMYLPPRGSPRLLDVSSLGLAADLIPVAAKEAYEPPTSPQIPLFDISRS